MMLPIALYPSDANRTKGLISIGVLLFLAYQVNIWTRGDGVPATMWMFLAAAAYIAFLVARNQLAPRPSFAADAEGFCVMGKAKRPWDEFRGASVRTVSYGFVPLSRMVVIKTGKNILGGRVQITPLYQSAPAKEMAHEIAQYAAMAMAAGQSVQPEAPAPMSKARMGQKFDELFGAFEAPAAQVQTQTQTPTQMPRAQVRGLSFEQRLADTGPISSTPRLSERLFGRRKVL